MIILVRYSEIGLKGGNRSVFENKLIDNMRSCLAKNNVKFGGIKNIYGRIAVETEDDCSCLRHVFGISSFSPAIDAGTTLEAAEQIILKNQMLNRLTKNKTFRVSCQRLDKEFPMDSQKIERELGSFVVEKKGNRARMKEFDFELGVEVIQGRLFLFTERIQGPGGLPVGVEGKVIAIIANEKDILAALLMMKRGCAIFPVLLKKIKTDKIEILEKFGSREKPSTIKKLDALKEVDEIAEKTRAIAVISGQTLENFKDLNLKTTVLRPLIAYDEDEINEWLERFKNLSGCCSKNIEKISNAITCATNAYNFSKNEITFLHDILRKLYEPNASNWFEFSLRPEDDLNFMLVHCYELKNQKFFAKNCKKRLNKIKTIIKNIDKMHKTSYATKFEQVTKDLKNQNAIWFGIAWQHNSPPILKLYFISFDNLVNIGILNKMVPSKQKEILLNDYFFGVTIGGQKQNELKVYTEHVDFNEEHILKVYKKHLPNLITPRLRRHISKLIKFKTDIKEYYLTFRFLAKKLQSIKLETFISSHNFKEYNSNFFRSPGKITQLAAHLLENDCLSRIVLAYENDKVSAIYYTLHE